MTGGTLGGVRRGLVYKLETVRLSAL